MPASASGATRIVNGVGPGESISDPETPGDGAADSVDSSDASAPGTETVGAIGRLPAGSSTGGDAVGGVASEGTAGVTVPSEAVPSVSAGRLGNGGSTNVPSELATPANAAHGAIAKPPSSGIQARVAGSSVRRPSQYTTHRPLGSTTG